MNIGLPAWENIKTFVCRLLTEGHIRLQPHELFKIILNEFPDQTRNQVRSIVKAMIAEGLLRYTNELSTTFIVRYQKDLLRISAATGPGSSTTDCAKILPSQSIHLSDGLAFGDGAHPTTQLCLQGIEIIMRICDKTETGCPLTVLDIGTGSGVLAIAAALMGAKRVVGVDTDPLACREARSNIQNNGMAEKIALHCGNIIAVKGQTFDLVVANLRMPTLKGLFDEIAAVLASGGFAVFSGFRPNERMALNDKLEMPGWAKVWEANNRGWMAMAVKRQPICRKFSALFSSDKGVTSRA